MPDLVPKRERLAPMDGAEAEEGVAQHEVADARAKLVGDRDAREAAAAASARVISKVATRVAAHR